MTTDSPPSPAASNQGSTTRPRVDPLPAKRGEIGYRESLNPPTPSNVESEPDVTAHQTPIPARHPADREAQPASSELGPPPITNVDGNQPSTSPQPSPRPISRSGSTKHGVRTSTILLLVTQGSLLLLTIALWVTLAKVVLPSTIAGRQIPTAVLVHTTFVICAIIQAILFERIFFRYRAERYAMLHPGEILPDLFNRGEQFSTRLALAPWNRPSLPTYAAVLMESGVGTGDVEDNHIAIMPPPAYGNTRDSTLLMAATISAEFHQQARPAREARRERSSPTTVVSVESNKTSNKSRPVSYITVDSEWDARCDMSRATYLSETLARLEAEERDLTTMQVVSPPPTQTGFVMNPPPSPEAPPPSPSAS